MALAGDPVATRYTCEFVERNLRADARNLLEIGCGAGELAATLGASGLKVDGIDSDPGCVADARSRGVKAEVAEWPKDVEARYDAVLFTRSLHHIHDLGGAVAAAARALQPDGGIIVEDFRAEGGSERSRQWFDHLVRSLGEEGALPDEVVSRLLAKVGPADHDHELHSSSAMAIALANFGELHAEESAYYFRYVEAAHGSAKLTQSVLDEELSLIASGAIDALGKRFVVTL